MRKTTKKFVSYFTMFALMSAMFGCYNVSAEQSAVSQSDILTSSELGCRGYQIRVTENEDGTGNVGFRTICYGPNIGSTITVGEEEYTIAEIGTLFVLDVDRSGVESDRVLGKEYAILDSNSRVDDGELISYRGANKYNGLNYTFGFVATDEGTNVSYKDNDGIDNTNYIRTITEMNGLIANTIQVRAFAIATDGTIIYSNTVGTLSVARIATVIYEGKLSQSATDHNNIYKYILNSELLADIYAQNNDYAYYRESEIEYDDWSPVVKP